MEFVDYDPISGITTTFTYDHASDQFTIGRHQDVEQIVERNKASQLDIDSHRKQAKNNWSLYASVPNILIEKWMTEQGVNFFDPNHWPKVMELINSRDYSLACKRTSYYHDR